MKDEDEYPGYLINKEGLRPIPKKIEAIKEAQSPQNITQLIAYLGMLYYYSKSMKNMSTLLKNYRWVRRKSVRNHEMIPKYVY